jgi:hypothetical protein
LAHASETVQGLPSEHATPVAEAVCWQPFLASQLSVVHGLPSSQLTAVPPHVPPAHLSGVVHAEPSSQAIALLVALQPSAVSQ